MTLRALDPERYQDFAPLGQGGMGVVYLAIDTELNRRVAFKMIRGAEVSASPLEDESTEATDEVKARFLQEAWVTGGLEHPGIVPVYELGQTPSGVPYYTMRLVRGELTLADSMASADRIEMRLALLEPFLKICDAIRYAHNRGVVHRDLKPANIALGEFGEAVVLDWGLAGVSRADTRWHRRIDEFRKESDLETLGSALGTPGYMSLEAALGNVEEVDQQSDVYSLGAILYEILTGRRPVVSESYAELIGKLKEPPVPPSDIDPAIPAGLARICLKALAVDKEERHRSVDELASAIRAWQGESAIDREIQALRKEAESALQSAEGLEGDALLRQVDRAVVVATRILDLRPGHAEAQALLDQARGTRQRAIEEHERTARRRLLKRVSIVGLLTATAATIVVALLLDAKRREAEDARALAVKAQRAEAAQRERAETERARAEDLAAFMLVELQEGLRPIGRLDLLDRVARKTLEYYETGSSENLTSHSWHTRVQALANVGAVLIATGDLPGALKSYKAALEISRRSAAEEPANLKWQRSVAEGHRALGKVLLRTGDATAALEHYRKAREIYERLAERDPSAGRQLRVSVVNSRIGDVLQAQGDLPGALERYRAGHAILESDPDNPGWQQALAASHDRIGGVLLSLGKAEEALASYRAAQVARERLADREPGNTEWRRDLALSLDNVGDVLQALGNRSAALEKYRAAEEISLRLVGQDPLNTKWQFGLSASQDRVGNMLLDTGDPNSALERYRASLEIRKRLVKKDPANTLWLDGLSVSYEKVADALTALGQHREGLAYQREAVKFARRLADRSPDMPKRQRDLAVSLLNMGITLGMLDEYKEALEVLGEAEEIHARVVEGAPQYRREHGKWIFSLRRVSLLAGEREPESPEEHLAAARALYKRKLYEASAKRFATALEDASIRGNLGRGNLYNAACAAALVGTVEWRKQSLEWLAEDLKRRRGLLARLEQDESERAKRLRQALLNHLEHARAKDADLASLRSLPEFRKLFE